MECYFCGNKTMVWASDWNYDEIYHEGEGLVSLWVCSHCNGEAQFSLKTKD